MRSQSSGYNLPVGVGPAVVVVMAGAPVVVMTGAAVVVMTGTLVVVSGTEANSRKVVH